MAGKFSLSKATFEALVQHLTKIEDGKHELVEEYFPEPSKERLEFKKLLDKYIIQLRTLVGNHRISKTAGNSLPFVIIGSEAEVRDLDSQEIYRFRIVSPFRSSRGGGDVSYLSPAGKSLLLKKTGDKVAVEAPGGVFRYEVKSITLPSK